MNAPTEASESAAENGASRQRRAPLWIEPALARRLKLQDGKVVGVIAVDQTGNPPRLELVEFQPLPRNMSGSDEELIDAMIASISG